MSALGGLAVPTENLSYFVTCARGLEPVLSRELEDLGAAQVTIGLGGVACQGDRRLLYLANLHLRTAIRVLVPVLQAPVDSPEALYDAVRGVDWCRYLTPDHTLAVDANVRDSNITHSHYAALKVKDAICDWFVARRGRRPNVDTTNPLVKLNVHLSNNNLVLSLDSSGASLHKRGYRPVQVKAPLNEALAAGLVQLSGWEPTQALIDPMCGSGTLAIEACWHAVRRPPGLTRRHFGFMGWPDFDIKLWTALRDEARRQVLSWLPSPIEGCDIRSDAVRWAGINARAAGIGHLLRFNRADACVLTPPRVSQPGWLMCNPPYGQRLGEQRQVHHLYRRWGENLRQHWAGWQVWVLSTDPLLPQRLALQPFQSLALWNGRLACRWWGFLIPG